MIFTRRDTLQLGLAGVAGTGRFRCRPSSCPSRRARKAKGDSYKTESGEIVINPISHASFVMSVPGPGDLQRPGWRQGAL